MRRCRPLVVVAVLLCLMWARPALVGKSPGVAAEFAPGGLAHAPPQWPARDADREEQTSRAISGGLNAGALTLAVGLVALTVFLLREGRTGLPGYAGLSRVSMPPDRTPPGLAVRLAGGSTPAVATLFDLAGRGLLRIEQSDKGLLGAMRYTLQRLPSRVELRPHEEGLLRILFGERGGEERDNLPLSEVARQLASRTKWYRGLLEQDLEAVGWLDPRRRAMRKWLIVAAFAAVLVGGVVMVVGFVVAASTAAKGGGAALTLGAVAAGVGAALCLLGPVALIATGALSPLSEGGELKAASWKAFASFLKDVCRGREFIAGRALFERYLPFAAGLGLGERWARYFHRQGYRAVPAWFHTLGANSDEFGAVMAVIASANASFSDADAKAVGATGASGGGSSGAG